MKRMLPAMLRTIKAGGKRIQGRDSRHEQGRGGSLRSKAHIPSEAAGVQTKTEVPTSSWVIACPAGATVSMASPSQGSNLRIRITRSLGKDQGTRDKPTTTKRQLKTRKYRNPGTPQNNAEPTSPSGTEFRLGHARPQVEPDPTGTKQQGQPHNPEWPSSKLPVASDASPSSGACPSGVFSQSLGNLGKFQPNPR